MTTQSAYEFLNHWEYNVALVVILNFPRYLEKSNKVRDTHSLPMTQNLPLNLYHKVLTYGQEL